MIRADRKSPRDVLKSPVVIAADVIALCADQLEAATEEASQDVDALTASFLAAVACDNSATVATGVVNGDNVDVTAEDASPAVEDRLQSIVIEAVARLQFADRLRQRLSNACRNLQASVEFLRRGDASLSVSEKADFLQSVRSSFTMEDERAMFDSVFPALNDDVDPAAPEHSDA